MQVLDQEPRGLRRPCAGHGEYIDEQAELGVAVIARGDKPAHVAIAQDDVAGDGGIRQRFQPGFPCLGVLDAPVVRGGEVERGSQALAVAHDAGRLQALFEQAIPPLAQLLGIEQRHRFGEQRRADMAAWAAGVVDAAAARFRSASYASSASPRVIGAKPVPAVAVSAFASPRASLRACTNA